MFFESTDFLLYHKKIFESIFLKILRKTQTTTLSSKSSRGFTSPFWARPGLAGGRIVYFPVLPSLILLEPSSRKSAVREKHPKSMKIGRFSSICFFFVGPKAFLRRGLRAGVVAPLGKIAGISLPQNLEKRKCSQKWSSWLENQHQPVRFKTLFEIKFVVTSNQSQ